MYLEKRYPSNWRSGWLALCRATAVGVMALCWQAVAAHAETLVLEATVGTASEPKESALLQPKVDAGELPPVAERLPDPPFVVPTTENRQIGVPGGKAIMLVGRGKDTRLFSVYGYARLVAFDENFDLYPDILERVEIEDGRIFTLHLRKGHRWSDGHPFTTEDFRYYWEDVALNEALSPSGPPRDLIIQETRPDVTVIDETTIRYSWPAPNPFFLPGLAGARPLYLYRPAHYMKRFHEAYGDAEEIDAAIEELGVRNWAALHNRLDNLYNFDNADLPTLQPWVLKTRPPAKRYTAERNPFYHRVDEKGQQLPYLDAFTLAVTGGGLISAKTGSGESDLQSRGLNFKDIPFLKQDEDRHNYEVRLWNTVRGSELALYPNLNAKDPVWRELFRDVRFRRALSLATDRGLINQAIYFGIGLEGNQSALPASPLHKPEYRQNWAEFDIDKANSLLDELGLDKRDKDGIRLLPDGRPMEIIIESAGENTEESDVLELIRDNWRAAGIKIFTKPSQREVLRNRIFAGETLISIWFGLENALLTPDLSPEEFVPVRQYSFQWPKWGQFYETRGRAGEDVDMPEAKELMDLYRAWLDATTPEKREEVWHRILEINADQVYTIGLVAQIPQPIVVRRNLRNVPAEAIYNWDPGAQFGIYRIDSFWVDPKG